MKHPGTDPSLSVVIPTYNARHLLQKHLPSVFKILQEGDEVIIVDDASTDDTASWIKSYEAPKGIRLKLEQHAKNKRFAAAVNTGVEAAKHPYVFLLNNDVSPLSTDIRQQILEPFMTDPELFSVGCAEVKKDSPDASISGRGTGGFKRGLMIHWYDPNQNSNRTLWTSGGSMAFDRAKYLEIGGMDTLFYPAYEEDRDLSYRALKHGWKIKFLPSARVLHQHETTNTTVFGRRNMAVMSWKNQFLIVWKNITDPWLLTQHILWLPYHLIFTNWRSRGAVMHGLWKAVLQFSEVRRKRQQTQKLWVRSDSSVLAEGK